MRISDWSADVCSSDRPGLVEPEEAAVRYGDPVGVAREVSEHHLGPGERRPGIDAPALLADRREVPQESAPFGEMCEAAKERERARKCDVEGTSVSVRVELGGSRDINK